MKPQEDFESVYRAAMVITPKQPFFDWLKKLEPSLEIDEEMQEGEVYLLPDFETKQEAERWLKKHFDTFFQQELCSWYTEPQLWPAKRTFKLFQEWFSFSLHTMVWDTLDEPLDKM